MNEVILNSIAETTTHRDRDGVHRAIVQLLLDFLEAESVAIYSLVDDGGVTRLLNYAEASHGKEYAPRSRSGDPSTLRELAEGFLELLGSHHVLLQQQFAELYGHETFL